LILERLQRLWGSGDKNQFMAFQSKEVVRNGKANPSGCTRDNYHLESSHIWVSQMSVSVKAFKFEDKEFLALA
jgi:hypothetical protein